MRARVAAARAYVDELRQAPCVDCGVQYHLAAMEFDHVRGEKQRNIAAFVVAGYTIDAIDAELEKCELRCANCHNIRHWEVRHAG